MLRTESVVVRDAIRASQPTVILIVGSEPLQQLLAFFREKCMSLSTERAYAQAVGRFVEWLSVRAPEFHALDQRALLYTAFVHDLRFGTYHEGVDQYGINWLPISDNNLRRLSRCLMEFSDWLCLRYGTTTLNPIQHNASVADQMVFWRQWNRRKAESILSHVKSRGRAATDAIVGRQMRLPRHRTIARAEVAAFPLDYIDTLLWKGFVRPGCDRETRPWLKYHLRDILITLLCLYGGCRVSEPMHLWVDDVFVDPDNPDSAIVLIHEPEIGGVHYTDPLTGTRRKTTRRDYLQRYCGGRRPLTEETGRRHAGWKGAMLNHRDRKAFRVFWIDSAAGRLFLTLWQMYISHERPLTPQMPWAFLTKEKQPLGAEGFSDAFNAAVRRIGLPRAKWAGTTTHGLRHRYGQWLNELGITDKEGQVAMHHLNARSQDVYRQIGLEEVVKAVGTASNITALPSFFDDIRQ